MNWWFYGPVTFLVLCAVAFTGLMYWAHWDLVTGKLDKKTVTQQKAPRGKVIKHYPHRQRRARQQG